MKIYIPNILPNTLTNKLTSLSNTFGNPKIKIKNEIISKEFGTYYIENIETTKPSKSTKSQTDNKCQNQSQNIYYIEPTFNQKYELIKNYKNNCDLLVDYTCYSKIPVVSQLPVDYINTEMVELEFKINHKSKLSLVVVCIDETNINDKTNNKIETKLFPFDFYFAYHSVKLDLNDVFFQNEFDKYLDDLL